ncbi:DNA-binding transcriptional regulator YbjK [Actinoplanes lutulentus]|uniref:TetR/AcrR family transcriptional regulator n=1 Tax=Actinoplanes lutulentus TaxID=1287878 RepID=UPI0017FDE917|nr:TetR family transcriptional regulator [Actinoplanes lutulentus]MBB2946804.1 DNA-binding transcriptional regulator YbjK [Actinoplanes lutulentus]
MRQATPAANPAKAAPAKATPAKAAPTKAGLPKASPSKAGLPKASPSKASPSQAGPTEKAHHDPTKRNNPRRARRHDPDRKDRIVDAAIQVIAEHGVAGTTHRLIAAAADVPLGSLTYHFTGLDDLRAQAFKRHAERMSATYAAHFDGVHDRDQLIDAVTRLIHGDAGADTHDWAIAYELYLAALRDPALREVTETWMRASRAVLERFVDPVTARGVDALIEGLVIHKTLATTPVPVEEIRAIVTRAVGKP